VSIGRGDKRSLTGTGSFCLCFFVRFFGSGSLVRVFHLSACSIAFFCAHSLHKACVVSSVCLGLFELGVFWLMFVGVNFWLMFVGVN
jgi:hypothetical protein